MGTASPAINILRVEWRFFLQGGYSVPREKIAPQYIRSLKFAVDVGRLADPAYFVDNTQDVDEGEGEIDPFTVFRTVDGKIAKSYFSEADFPQWAKTIYNSLKK